MASRFPSPAALALPLLLLLAGCDSSGPDDGPGQAEFNVRYELSGTCFGIQVYAYNVTTGGTTSENSSGTFTLPWSRDQVASAPSSPTATALSATCQGANEAAQTLTGRILVDGVERAVQTNEGTGSISVTLSVMLR